MSPCQLELRYYRLEMVPGYRVSHEDCEVPPPVLLTTLSNTLYRQVCGYTGGPLLLRATTLASIADSAVPRSLALLDLAIQVTHDSVKTTFLMRVAGSGHQRDAGVPGHDVPHAALAGARGAGAGGDEAGVAAAGHQAPAAGGQDQLPAGVPPPVLLPRGGAQL